MTTKDLREIENSLLYLPARPINLKINSINKKYPQNKSTSSVTCYFIKLILFSEMMLIVFIITAFLIIPSFRRLGE